MRLSRLLLLALLLVPSVALARRAPMPDDFVPRPRIVRPAVPEALGSDLSALNALPADHAQLVVWYDGRRDARPSLHLQCITAPGRRPQSFGINALPRSSQIEPGRVATLQLRMNGCVPTGVARVQGVVADGVIDGVAFGLLYRDTEGVVHLLRSTSARGGMPHTVGMWPIAFSDAHFARQTPQLSGSAARQHARAILSGAQYLDNGTHTIPFYGLPR